MRLAFDLFPCQTASRFRGIGRFARSLAGSMARLRGEHEMFALASGLYPENMDALRKDLAPLLPPGHFCGYTHPPLDYLAADNAARAGVAAALVHRAYQAVTPDAVLYASPFEGWGEQGVAALPHGTLPAALRVAVLYDFIPWLFPEQHFGQSSRYKEWYQRRLAALRGFDLLLAISEATRRDAIHILEISPDRVVNISGAAVPLFRPMATTERAEPVIARFGIVRPFVLYTGNADYRKNLDGMLHAYARLPTALRNAHQLVLNQVGDIAAFRRKARALGLADEEVVVTGHIGDDELRCLYAGCKVFVFPSLYEGFGLPVLEAMACGAPVIAADNSSIPELVERSDVLFDAADPGSIATVLQKALSDEKWRREIACYGIERSRIFSWERSAAFAWHAIEASLAAKRASSSLPCAPQLPKPCIAMVCSLLQQDAPATRHCMEVLPLLALHFEIDLFVEAGTQEQLSLFKPAMRVYPHTELASRRDRYTTVAYQLANSPAHAFMLSLMERFPGVVVLHDLEMNAAVQALAERGIAHAVESEILYSDGLQALIAYLRKNGDEQFPLLSRHVLESAQRLVLPGADVGLPAMRGCGAWLPPVTRLNSGDVESDMAAYAQAINAAAAGDEIHTIRHLADALEGSSASNLALSEIASHAAGNWSLRKQPRILIDVTQLSESDARTGIQRVVRSIAAEMGNGAAPDRPVELVRQADGRLWRAVNVIASVFGVSEQRIPRQEIFAQPSDILLMIDSSWEQYADFAAIFQSVRQFGGKIVTVVYDLIPLQMPEVCSKGLVSVFNAWFRNAVEQSDMLLCISRSTAEAVTAHLAAHHTDAGNTPEIRYWPLGADIAPDPQQASVRPQVDKMAADKQSPLFLMVGTIEPRKGHAFALDAFDLLWDSGADLRLCIAGQEGWHVEQTMQRIRAHPQLHKRLFFIENPADAEINLCYAAASALIAASRAEGYGLPIVEAALHQVPVLVSDIPVFREVGGDGAGYFSLAAPQCLADAIKRFCETPPEERAMKGAKIKTVTWRESAAQMLERIL